MTFSMINLLLNTSFEYHQLQICQVWRLFLSGAVQYMNHVYCLQPSSAIIISQSVSFERTGACLHVMECHFEVSKYGRRRFKARSIGRFQALASKCSRFITVEIFMPARGEWQMTNFSPSHSALDHSSPNVSIFSAHY